MKTLEVKVEEKIQSHSAHLHNQSLNVKYSPDRARDMISKIKSKILKQKNRVF